MHDPILPSRPARWKGALIGLAVAIFFLAIAGVMSWSAPATTIHLSRHDQGEVTAEITTQVLLVIQTNLQSVANINGVRSETYRPPRSREDRAGRQETSKPEKIGYLLLTSPAGETKITVTPVQLAEREERVLAFLAGIETNLELWTIANWKFGVIIPAILFAIGTLTLLGIIGSLLRAIVTG